MASFFNGSSNAFLIGLWNSGTILGLPTFPFVNPGTLNLNQQTLYSSVLYYPNNSGYNQYLVAQICSWISTTNTQYIALIVAPLYNQGFASQTAFSIPSFTITF